MLTKKILSFGRYIRRAYITGSDRKTVLGRLRVGGVVESVGETMFLKGFIAIPKRDDAVITIYPGAYEVNQKHLTLHSSTDLYKLFYSRFSNPDDIFIRSRNFNQRMTVPNTIAYGEFEGHGTPLSHEMYVLYGSLDTDAYPADIPEHDGAGIRFVNSSVNEVKLKGNSKSEGYKFQIVPDKPSPSGSLYEYLARFRMLPNDTEDPDNPDPEHKSILFPELDLTGEISTGLANKLPLDYVSKSFRKLYDCMVMLESKGKIILTVANFDPNNKKVNAASNVFSEEGRSQLELNKDGEVKIRAGKVFEVIADQFKGGSGDGGGADAEGNIIIHDDVDSKLHISSDGNTRFENTGKYHSIIFSHPPRPPKNTSRLKGMHEVQGADDFEMPKNIDYFIADYMMDNSGSAKYQLTNEYQLTIDGNTKKLPLEEDKPSARFRVDKDGNVFFHLVKVYSLALDPDPNKLPEYEDTPSSRFNIDNAGKASVELIDEYKVAVDPDPKKLKGKTNSKLTIKNDGTAKYDLKKEFEVKINDGDFIIKASTDTSKIDINAGATTVTVHKDGKIEMNTPEDINMTAANNVNITAKTLNVNGDAVISETLKVAKSIEAGTSIAAGTTITAGSSITAGGAVTATGFSAPGGEWHPEGHGHG